jgi:folate-binding protein YgfZ
VLPAPPATLGGLLPALSLSETYAALHERVVGIVVAVDVVTVAGPDALSYLQGQVSQDLGGLAPGDSAETLVLSPQGKLDGYGRVVRTGDTTVAVVVDGGLGEALEARLRRFKVRVAAELGLTRAQAAILRGPAAHPAAATATAAMVLDVDHPGFSGCDLVDTVAALPSGVPEGDAAAFEAARIEAGLPVMGRELSGGTIPQEAGLIARAVSLTKGCYTGQELVARLDARGGRVARRLVGFVVDSGSPAAGDAIAVEGKPVGQLTSVAYSPRTSCAVALGYLRREIVVPARVDVDHAGSLLTAEAAELPLWRAVGSP